MSGLTARQERVLAALSRWPADADGWRSPGNGVLGSRSSVKRVRAELVASGIVAYDEGRGRGLRSRWKILAPLPEKGPGKGPKRVQKGSTRSKPTGPRCDHCHMPVASDLSCGCGSAR